MKNPKPTFYDLLQVARDAGPAVIRYAYRFQSAMCHPDNTETGNPEKFRELTEAWRILSDESKRSEYDRTLGLDETSWLLLLTSMSVSGSLEFWRAANLDENNHVEPDGSDLDEIFCRQGASLKAFEIPVLNEGNENDLKTRLKLVGYYFKFRASMSQTQEERQKHVLWMIDHRPSDAICGTPWIKGDGRFRAFYDEAKAHWLLQVEANPRNAAIIVNAGIFL